MERIKPEDRELAADYLESLILTGRSQEACALIHGFLRQDTDTFHAVLENYTVTAYYASLVQFDVDTNALLARQGDPPRPLTLQLWGDDHWSHGVWADEYYDPVTCSHCGADLLRGPFVLHRCS